MTLQKLENRVRAVKNSVKHFVQRGKRGYDETSHWNADAYLANVMAGVLSDLRDSPYSHLDDLDRHIKVLAEYSEKIDDFDNPHYILELRVTLRWIAENFERLWD